MADDEISVLVLVELRRRIPTSASPDILFTIFSFKPHVLHVKSIEKVTRDLNSNNPGLSVWTSLCSVSAMLLCDLFILVPGLARSMTTAEEVVVYLSIIQSFQINVAVLTNQTELFEL